LKYEYFQNKDEEHSGCLCPIYHVGVFNFVWNTSAEA
jgi:hypothetical protein